jgi:hypothetical protein
VKEAIMTNATQGATQGTTDGSRQRQTDTGQAGAGGSAPLKDRVADATHKLVDDTRQKVKGEVQSRLDTRKRRTSETLSAIASTLQQGHVEDEETARFMQKAGDQVQRLSRYLDETDLPAMARQAEDMARRQPAVFLGTAFVLGLVAARFFKAGRNRNQSRQGGPVTAGSGEPLESHPGFRPMPDDLTGPGPVGGYPGASGYAGQGL